jgi:hypothetical protein
MNINQTKWLKKIKPSAFNIVCGTDTFYNRLGDFKLAF